MYTYTITTSIIAATCRGEQTPAMTWSKLVDVTHERPEGGFPDEDDDRESESAGLEKPPAIL